MKVSGKKLKPGVTSAGDCVGDNKVQVAAGRAGDKPDAPARAGRRRSPDRRATRPGCPQGARPAAREARTTALLALGLDGWRRSAGAAGLAHTAEERQTITTTFGSEADGTGGKATVTLDEAGGDKLGFKARVDAEVAMTGDGLEKLAGKNQVSTEVKSGKAKVAVSFEDAPQGCPSAAGIVDGRLHGRASITITVTSPSGSTTEMHRAPTPT